MRIRKADITKAGYRRINMKAHILAGKNRKVYEHRAILFAVIGYGPHLCPECGKIINWGYGLETDHIDGDRANNAVENLRPLCVPCNRRWRRRRRSVSALRPEGRV